MEQRINCPSCGTLTATLNINTPHRIVLQSKPVDPDLPEWMAQFVQDCCRLESDLRIVASELRTAYERWAQDNGVSPVTPKRFGMEVALLPGVERTRVSEARMYVGIGLVS